MGIPSAVPSSGGYYGEVTPADLGEWERELGGVAARLQSLFYRPESKKHAEQYLRGLLAPLARKNGWTIAEVLLQTALYAGVPAANTAFAIANEELSLEQNREQ